MSDECANCRKIITTGTKYWWLRHNSEHLCSKKCVLSYYAIDESDIGTSVEK